ncbi:MAG: DUF1475 family protein [Vampirovibrionales bacterium]|nr:DUF1475 family protein [Vampirovibrionales bacterium]
MRYLKSWFLLVFVIMLIVVGWASVDENIFEIPSAVKNDPWFIATLFDTYFAFIAIYLFMAYRSPSWISRLLWFVMVMGLGNIGIALYFLILIYKLPPNATMKEFLLRPGT